LVGVRCQAFEPVPLPPIFPVALVLYQKLKSGATTTVPVTGPIEGNADVQPTQD